MDNNRIEYVFKECECRRADFVYFNASKKTPICPEHRTRLAHKIRWCSVCGAETVCSNYSNSKRFICPDCRRANNLKIKRDRALKKKNSRTDVGFRANTGLKHRPEAEVPLFARLLEKKFPKLEMPVMSSELKRICSVSVKLIYCKRLKSTHSEKTCATRYKMSQITTEWVPTISRFSPESTYPIELGECKNCQIGKECLDKIGTENIVLRGNGQIGFRRKMRLKSR